MAAPGGLATTSPTRPAAIVPKGVAAGPGRGSFVVSREARSVMKRGPSLKKERCEGARCMALPWRWFLKHQESCQKSTSPPDHRKAANLRSCRAVLAASAEDGRLRACGDVTAGGGGAILHGSAAAFGVGEFGLSQVGDGLRPHGVGPGIATHALEAAGKGGE